ncbi:putative MFS family arabinose efflux permease [Micromonospora palomenae]|uniref:Putative MFS family arabinose efflux permease n=1 Tax=Micromonospora palomenae TaxID=1461247 RepID=A0A561WEH2_9ACTN|nr:MFS transporter [Micromonospora palomenae]TWG22268.1 putative MFS family arabinose efflux permease [Micromonospora palomenae]
MSFTSGGSRWSDVWLAATARGTTICGDFLAATALALALQAAGASGLAVSGLLLAATLPLVVLAPLAGRLADRVDSRRLLVTVGLAQAALCALLAFAEHPVLVIGLVALLACGLAVTQPCLAALLPAMVRPDDLPRASAVNQTAVSLGALAGPVLAGLLVGQFGTRVPLLLDAVSYLALVVAGLLLRTRRGGRRTATATAATTTGPAPAWRLRRDPLLLAVVVTTAAVIAAIGGINVIEVFFIRDTLDSSATIYGLVGAAWMAGMLPGSWLAARLARRLTDDGALVYGVLATLGGCSLMVVLASAVPAAGLLVPLWLVGGAANGGENVFANVLTARRAPEALRARAYATYGAAVQGGSMAGYLAGGALLAVLPPRPLIAVAGAAGLLVVLAFVPVVVRAVRRAGSAVGPVEPAVAAEPGGRAVGAELATPVPGR